MKNTITIASITVNQDFISVFGEETYPQHIRGGMILTDRIEAQNLRLRESAAGYQADWHVAGDATLIIIQQGTLRISLRDGTFKDFSAGDSFIAKDHLPDGFNFNPEIHGHQASVIGTENLKAVHIKLVMD